MDFKPAVDYYLVREVNYRSRKDYFDGIAWPVNHLIKLVTISKTNHEEDFDQDYNTGDAILIDYIPALNLTIDDVEYLLIHENDILGKVEINE